jgi:phospholipase C
VSRDDFSRREWLRRMGLGAGGVALARYLAACEDGDARRAVDFRPDFGAGQMGPAPDASAPDAAPPDAANPDVGAPPMDLAPLRGDGTHPFDYIDTLVIVQFENRSFDHLFGSLSLLEGRADVDGLRPGMSNPDASGRLIEPAHLPPEAYVVDPDPGHSRRASHAQFNDGANDGFVREWQGNLPPDDPRLPWIMGYYTRSDLPAAYALADRFALCQRWHASLLASTWPNRFYSHCATSDGNWDNSQVCAAPTPYPALAAAGYSYKIYFHNLYFAATITSLQQKNAFKSDRFFDDAAAGTLPNVSVLEPAFFMNDDHPPADVRLGDAFLASVYEALRQSPQWPRCLMVVFYDEHGGFFDHVPPPKAPGETRAAEGFDQLGFRVPALCIGPLVKRGHVSSDVFEHSSVPKLISDVFGLDYVNERSRLAGDLSSVLDLRYVRGVERPVPEPIQPVPVPMRAFERAMQADSGQPELQEWMRRAGLAHHDSLPERRRLVRRYLDHALRLNALELG